MKVRHVVEKEDGSVVFQGILEARELAFVLETGLDYLIEQGHIPFVSLENYNPADLHDTHESSQ